MKDNGEEHMLVVFDLDNTLADEFGATLRPGIIDLLDNLKSLGVSLALWTNSTRDRALVILRDHKIRK